MIALLLFLILAFLIVSSMIHITTEALTFIIALFIFLIVLLFRHFIHK